LQVVEPAGPGLHVSVCFWGRWIGASQLRRLFPGARLNHQGQLAQRIEAWHNFYDRLDIVALDADLNDDYDGVIGDEPIRNTFIKKDVPTFTTSKNLYYGRRPSGSFGSTPSMKGRRRSLLVS
jgi:hypothetical protein